ncbi:MAG: glutamate-5-semialdehyde dehydrogenase [Planctomyces sp.]
MTHTAVAQTPPRTLALQARSTVTALATLATADKNLWLQMLAEALRASVDAVVSANLQDLAAARQSGMSEAMLDRLRLDEPRIQSLATAVQQICALPDPVGEVISGERRPNGLQVSRVRVPLGVVFFIYESRPNVTVDAAALCVKSGNPVILRGGSEAIRTNLELGRLITETLAAAGLPEHAVQVVGSTDRQLVGEFLQMSDLISLAIPRGGRSLIERVVREAAMPVLKHFDGVCHVFVDESAELQMALDIVINSKCQRPAVCNAAETLLLHVNAAELWPALAAALQQRGVELRCCERSRAGIAGAVVATEQDYRTEHGALILNVRIVDSLAEAIEHIRTYGSGHTDAIVTRCLEAAGHFESAVDSSAVVINASTRFNDGGELGLGAEIGISTDRFHARGPCGLRELTTYKYVIRGTGQVRG